MNTKTCATCKIEKPLEDFRPYNKSEDGYAKNCKACAHELYEFNQGRARHEEDQRLKDRRTKDYHVADIDLLKRLEKAATTQKPTQLGNTPCRSITAMIAATIDELGIER